MGNVPASKLVEATHQYEYLTLGFCLVQVGGAFCFAPSERHMYCLVSVVEHFGRSGSGHYTVYRRVKAKNDGDVVRWFCISDSQVHSVSEDEVLAAEASVLFYERISED